VFAPLLLEKRGEGERWWGRRKRECYERGSYSTVLLGGGEEGEE
jgi:hypothetical protein